MLEPPSLEKRLIEVFNELEEELSVVNAGILFIHISEKRIATFGVRQQPEFDNTAKIIKPDRSGLSSAHQRSFRNMVIELLTKQDNCTDGEISFSFSVLVRVLKVSVCYKS